MVIYIKLITFVPKTKKTTTGPIGTVDSTCSHAPLLDERKTAAPLWAQVQQRWAWRIGGVGALLLSGAERPSRSSRRRQQGGAVIRRGALSESN